MMPKFEKHLYEVTGEILTLVKLLLCLLQPQSVTISHIQVVSN